MSEVTRGVLLMADAYEIVERRAQLEARAQGADAEARRLRAELRDRERGNPAAAALADDLIRQWERDRFAGFSAAAWLALPLGWHTALTAKVVLDGLTTVVTAVGAGSARRGAPRAGWSPPLRVETRSMAAVAPPVSLADAVARIPDGDAQVRVEKYTMADGSRQFAVYIDGTRSADVSEPWNMVSNVTLYAGVTAPSYDATRRALADAGAQPGDALHVVGYSQGAMVAGYLATAGEYDVRTHVSIGSPTAPALGETTLSAQFRHTDDLVSVLAGGGRPDGVGAPGSVVVERRGDPELGVQDLGLPAHTRESYRETVATFEASGDPRVKTFDPLWRELATAASVDVTETLAVVVPTPSLAEPIVSDETSSGGGGSRQIPR